MMKLFTTLMRSAVAEAEDAVFDANALRLLAQHLRDAAEALEHSKRELACAMAHRAAEARAVAALTQRIADLEVGARDALDADRLDLAEQAATVIAANEDERKARCDAMATFDADIARLRRLSDEGRNRLLELRRGLEIARAQDALRRAGANGRRALATGSGALRDAEATLARIRDANDQSADVAEALDDLERTSSGRDLDERLAKAGCGVRVKSNPADVLARLKHARASGVSAPSQPAPKPQ
jgi:phage shock protein A